MIYNGAGHHHPFFGGAGNLEIVSTRLNNYANELPNIRSD